MNLFKNWSRIWVIFFCLFVLGVDRFNRPVIRIVFDSLTEEPVKEAKRMLRFIAEYKKGFTIRDNSWKCLEKDDEIFKLLPAKVTDYSMWTPDSIHFVCKKLKVTLFCNVFSRYTFRCYTNLINSMPWNFAKLVFLSLSGRGY